MFAVIFICDNLFLLIVGKITKNTKIRTCKNFVPHGSHPVKTRGDGRGDGRVRRIFLSSPFL